MYTIIFKGRQIIFKSHVRQVDHFQRVLNGHDFLFGHLNLFVQFIALLLQEELFLGVFYFKMGDRQRLAIFIFACISCVVIGSVFLRVVAYPGTSVRYGTFSATVQA